MASVKSSSLFVTVSMGRNVIAVNFDSMEVHNLECDLNKFSAGCNVQKSDYSSNLDETVFLPCSDLSKCGKWFIFSYKKCLLLWRTSDWSFVSYAELHRTPSKIKFSADACKIIIVDKSGDVFTYVRDNLSQGGSLLLGHLSLLFDVTITPDEKFIISCDRDEKIRVSCYPNAYNIYSFCLGHEDFITSLDLLPHCPSVLISVSGDETLRLWDFKNGRQLLKYVCFDDIDSKYVDLEEDVPLEESVAIVKCVSFQSNSNESVVCILFNNYKGCIIYTIKGSFSEFVCEKLQVLNFSVVPCDIYFGNDFLWVVSATDKFELLAFQWNKIENCFVSNLSNNNIQNAVAAMNSKLVNFECNFKNKISILYKKQFDEIPEYHKRKNNNLCEPSKKNKTNSD